MKSSQYLKIGILLSVIYYVLDALLDSLIFYSDQSFIQVLITEVPVSELYNRFLTILLIIVTVLMIRLFQLRISMIKIDMGEKEKDLFSDLNDTSVIELVSHQLKTSLTTIIGFSNLLNDETITDESKKLYNEYVYSSSTNLLQLFNNLVDLNRLVNDRHVINKESCRINKILDEIQRKYETDLANKQKNRIELKLNLPKGYSNLSLITDCKKLQHIVEGLLENAINFSNEGEIEFGYFVEENKKIKFYFRDEGVGLSLEKLEDAFAQYKTRQKSLDASFDLAALRIMVVKGFVELLGGKLWSDSHMGEGSTFYFSLPMIQHEEEESRMMVDGEEVPDWSDYHILIAEDIESNYLLIKELVKPTGANLVWAKNGKEAVDYYEKYNKKVDLVMLDIVMPEMDGFEAAEKIRGINKQVPVIGQTAFSLECENNPGQLSNFNDYLTKPIWYHELINTLSKYLV